MKALMLPFLIILFQSCFSAGPNNNRTSQHDDEQSSSSPKDKTEKPIAQQSDKQYTSLKDFQLETSTDSLRPTQSWTFNYIDGTFPSDSSHWDECLIKGFDTDGKGRFYFLGGEPIRLACYNGEKLEWTRELGLSMVQSQQAMFKLVEDSIYFLKEENKTIYRIHKNGQGDIEAFPLPFGQDDTFRAGRFKDNSYYVEVRPGELTEDSVPFYDNSHNVACLFTYPNNLQMKIIARNKIDSLALDGTPKYPELEDQAPYFVFYQVINQHLIYKLGQTMN